MSIVVKQKERTEEMEHLICDYHAAMCKVFSHPKRLEILRLLKDKEMSVTEIAKATKMSIGNLSQHLGMMKQRHILESRKEGATVFYRFTNDKIIKAFTLLREALLEQLKKDAALIR